LRHVEWKYEGVNVCENNKKIKLSLNNILLFSSVSASNLPTKRFQTIESLEPDIWASVWLIDRIAEGTVSTLVEADPTPRKGYLSFGFRGADIYNPKGSNYQALLSHLNANDSVLASLGELVSNVENLGWQVSNNDNVSEFETEFRRMQAVYGRYWVPVGCYKQFFDQYYERISGAVSPEQSSVGMSCEEDSLIGKISRPSIPMVPIERVLQEISTDKKVVFVDTREPSEFAEQHIPGAINVPFRDIANSDLELLRDADLVIPYCIKDFRGFEAARRFGEHGVSKVSLLEPFGLAGWLQKGLPVAGDRGLSEQKAAEQLQECVETECLTVGKQAL